MPLPSDYQDLLRAILAITKSREKARDKIAHGAWGVCTDLPDALLLASPKDLLMGIDERKIFVYREKDFTEIILANERLADYGFDFNIVISSYSDDQGGRRYARLCAEPEIREILDRQASPAQSRPEESS